MIKGGIGGARTLTGLKFESRVSLKEVFEQIPNFNVEGDIVYYKGKKVAQLFQKYKLYKDFLEPNNINYSDFISKRLLPDEAILVFHTKTIFIVEMKFQEVAGSVDEKLQTCDFKNKQYNKLLSTLDIKAKYVYVLNDWFRKKEYLDVLDYISDVDCYYFFNILPLEFLDLKFKD